MSKIATHYGFLNNGQILKEITSKELRQNSKKKIQIKVTNINECVKLFEKNNISYEVISSEQINIYNNINISNLAIALSKRNCSIKEIQEKEETLESYYMNLLGGEKNV